MSVCEVCGNDHRTSFEIHTVSGDRHVLDSFEGAAHRLAPICEHCRCRILGHGVDTSGGELAPMFIIGGVLGTLEAHVFPAVVPWSAIWPGFLGCVPQ